MNYVRNSVKATVDVYDGTIHYYVVDPSDPIIQTYRKAFPDLFSDVDDMPDGLQDHWRYPVDIFSTQTEQYTQYHMTDPQQFFQKATLWDIAPSPGTADATSASTVPAANGQDGGRNSTLSSSGNPIDPLYLMMQTPDGKRVRSSCSNGRSCRAGRRTNCRPSSSPATTARTTASSRSTDCPTTRPRPRRFARRR